MRSLAATLHRSHNFFTRIHTHKQVSVIITYFAPDILGWLHEAKSAAAPA